MQDGPGALLCTQTVRQAHSLHRDQGSCLIGFMKIQKRIEWAVLLLFVLLALLCFFMPAKMLHAFLIAGAIGTACSAVILLVHGVMRHRGVDLAAGIALVVFTGIFVLALRNSIDFAAWAAGIYLSFCGMILLIQAFLDFKAGAKDGWGLLLLGALYLALGIAAIVWRRSDERMLMRIAGLYLLLQAVQLLVEEYVFSGTYNVRYYSFRDWLSLPAFLVGTLPAVVYMILLRSRLKRDPNGYDYRKNDEQPDLSVFIHTGTYASKLYGHMTFSRNDVAYSYGDYDYSAEKLFHMIGPGTFFTAGSAVYSNNCSIVENSPQFEYGIRLSEAQKKAFDEMVEGILENTEPWKCRLEAMSYEEGVRAFPSLEHLYADRLWWRTGCAFRQYHKGEWAWYSLLGNNCSNFAAAKLNEIGLKIPVAKAIVSPGEFFEYFEQALQDPDSPVISRSWHSAAMPSTLFDTID